MNNTQDSTDEAVLHNKSNKKRNSILIAVGIIVLGGFWAFTLLQTQAEEAEPAATITYSTDEPDEEKPSDEFEWQGNPEDPKFIRLPSIDGEGFVQNVGVDQNNAVAVPDNVHMAGWFTDTVLPGEKGLSIIDGHVTGRTTDGIFIHLEQLKPGDTYSIEFGDGHRKQFEVLKITSVKEKDAAAILFSQNPDVSNQLNLITCGGDFDTDTNQYEDRVIVSSKLVP